MNDRIVQTFKNCIGTACFLVAVLLITVPLAALEKPEGAIQKIRQRCFSILFHAIKSENAYIRGAAARAAGESKDPALIPLLKKASTDVYHTNRLFALQGLKSFSEKDAAATALNLSRDSNVWVKSAALEILGELGGPEAKEKIRPQLDSPDRPVRMAAAAALYKLGEKEHLSLLLEMSRDSNSISRYQAIGYLGKIRTEEMLPHLTALLDDREDEVVFYSLKAIGPLARPDIFPQLTKLTLSNNPSIRYQAVLIMGHLPPDISLSRVRELCEDADPMVRVSAAVSMNRLGSEECGKVFAEELENSDYGVRSTAARILGEINLSDRVQLLDHALKDENTRVRTAGVRAVGMMGGAEAFPLLMRMLDDPQEAVRAYAAGNLIKLTS
ncbi:MAG: hypothetical protein NPINA01_09220 [Nitrospinaceae bacterium]|nr:MAG: hypothetical protein NPINA01_09220 [Nitrospinaceae bacterium]